MSAQESARAYICSGQERGVEGRLSGREDGEQCALLRNDREKGRQGGGLGEGGGNKNTRIVSRSLASMFARS
jgi:hypothetical protein